MSEEQKKLIKNIKTCIAKPEKTLDYSLLSCEINGKVAKNILQIVHKTLTSPKAKVEQREAGRQ
jgi:hypothetical protein